MSLQSALKAKNRAGTNFESASIRLESMESQKARLEVVADVLQRGIAKTAAKIKSAATGTDVSEERRTIERASSSLIKTKKRIATATRSISKLKARKDQASFRLDRAKSNFRNLERRSESLLGPIRSQGTFSFDRSRKNKFT